MKSKILKPTVIDVAREAGVSPMTVSRTLHRPEKVGYEGTLHFLAMDKHPTALLCTSSTIAIGALMALQEQQVAIPAEMAFVTFGNMDWTSLVTPSLTVITQPTVEMGLQAAQIVLDQLRFRMGPETFTRPGCAPRSNAS